MKILITGSEGYIASHLIKKLESLSHELLLIDRNIDVNSDKFLKLAKDFKPDILYHLARSSTPKSSFENIEQDIKDTVIGTMNVLKVGCKVVFPSSSVVYGEKTLATEEDLPSPQSPYAINKLIAEHYIKISRLPYVILRISSVYGRGVLHGAIWALQKGKEINSNCVRDFIHVDDVVEAMIQAQGWKSDIYNIGSGESHYIDEVAKALGIIPKFKKKSLKEPKVISLWITRAMKEGWEPRINIHQGLKKL